MESKMFAFALFMLFSIVQSSAALKCYDCSSVTNPKCADIKEDERFQARDCIVKSYLSQAFENVSQFTRDYLSNSAHIEFLTSVCFKMVFYDGTRDVVTRNCTMKVQSKDLCTAISASSERQNTPIKYCGTCDTDGCNSGNSMRLFSTLITFGAMVYTARLFV